MAQVAALSLSPSSNAYTAGNVDRGGEGDQLTQKSLPHEACASWEAGKCCWLTSPLHLPHTYGF